MFITSPKTGMAIIILLVWCVALVAQSNTKPETGTTGQIEIMDLEQCLNLGLQNNHLARVSAQDLEVARAQYRQVLSSFWPQISLSANYIRLDHNPSFVYPQETSEYTVNGLPLPNLPPGTPLNMTVTVPEKSAQIMDRDNGSLSLDVLFPLFIGGKRFALRKQALGQMGLREQDIRKTDLQITREISERYYGNVLAKILKRLGQQTVDRIMVTLDLTERMYKNGSGSVSKTDYLKNKLFATTVQAMQTSLKKNVHLSASALTFTLGRKAGNPVTAADQELPYKPIPTDLDPYLKQVFTSNPDWLKSEQALNIYQAKISEARSEYLFRLALIGKVNRIYNSYDYGTVSARDKKSWMLGVSVELPLFTGLSTRFKVQEMQARKAAFKSQKARLKDGLVLQIEEELGTIKSLQDKLTLIKEAKETATENRDLTERAYAIEMATAEDMIQAQLFESMAAAQYYKALYDHIVARAKLDYLVGTGIENVQNK